VANTYTPGLKLRQPAQGDDLWDDDLNANAAILEATLGRNAGITGVIGATLVVSEDTGLTVSYTAGSCRVEGTKRTITAGTKACADNALNFIYVNSSGAVTVVTSLPSPPYCALALVETSGGAIARIGDLRRRIVDALAEHTEAGAHGQITPSRVTPSGTDGAYKRSACAACQSPESQVNNTILKNDSTPLVVLSAKDQTYGALFTAASLGSGYVPADANGLIVGARVFDTTNGQRSYWLLYPYGAASDDDVRHAALVRSYLDGGVATYAQRIIFLGGNGLFNVTCGSAPQATAALTLRLVGWIEPA